MAHNWVLLIKLSYHSGPSIGSQAEFGLLSGTCMDGIETCIKLVPGCYWYKAGIASGILDWSVL